jgi:hypothetical protein
MPYQGDFVSNLLRGIEPGQPQPRPAAGPAAERHARWAAGDCAKSTSTALRYVSLTPLLFIATACATVTAEPVAQVSLVRLIVEGDPYDSAVIMTQGFAATGPRGPALYLNEGAASNNLFSLRIPVDLSDLASDAARFADAEDRLDGHWVSIRARFVSLPAGSEAAGGLNHVEAIVVHDEPETNQ